MLAIGRQVAIQNLRTISEIFITQIESQMGFGLVYYAKVEFFFTTRKQTISERVTIKRQIYFLKVTSKYNYIEFTLYENFFDTQGDLLGPFGWNAPKSPIPYYSWVIWELLSIDFIYLANLIFNISMDSFSRSVYLSTSFSLRSLISDVLYFLYLLMCALLDIILAWLHSRKKLRE